MRVLRLGIVGGCLSHQAGTPISLLYHRVLSELLDDAYGVTLRPVIERSFDRPLNERLAAVARSQPALVLVHARNTPLLSSVRLYRHGLAQSEDDDCERPADEAGERRAGAAGAPRAHTTGAGFHRPPQTTWISQANIALGVLRGRHRRFANGMVREIVLASAQARDAANHDAATLRLPVAPFVVGFTMRFRGPADRLACRAANRSLRRACERHGLVFVDVLRGWQRGFCLADGHHLTAAGHRYLAERLFAEVGPLLGAGGATSPGQA